MAARVVWDWQELAIDVSQELFALEQFSRRLSRLPESEKELSDKTIEHAIQVYAKLNLETLRNACREVSPQLSRLASRVEAYAFVKFSEDPKKAERKRAKRKKKDTTIELERLILNKGITEINMLADFVPEMRHTAIRKVKSRILNEAKKRKS